VQDRDALQHTTNRKAVHPMTLNDLHCQSPNAILFNCDSSWCCAADDHIYTDRASRGPSVTWASWFT